MNPIDFSDRCRGAIWGQIVGDAAALGTHWIYDLDAMQSAYPELAGFEEPRQGHYHFGKKPGDLTHYGEGALLMTESVAELGRFDPFHFGAKFVAHFGSPSYSGYLDKATKGTLSRKAEFEREHPGHEFVFQSGAHDQQMATVSRLAPLVVTHFHDPKLLECVERATRVTQDDDVAVLYAKADALILLELLRGRDFRWAINETAEELIKAPVHGSELHRDIRNARQAETLGVTEATDQFGQGCPLPQSFPSSIQCVLRHGDSYRETILSNIRAGGDNAGRGAMLGAWMGAILGVHAIPEEWRRNLHSFEAVETAVESIVSRLASVGATA